VIILEELDFEWDKKDIEKVNELWNQGAHLKNICKMMYQKNGKYSRDEIIVTCMGGVVIVE